ncbi:MAG: 3'(2'),5'-bisphosphate nucleotidase CysQ [Candidatus Korobacteraceae bacterium]
MLTENAERTYLQRIKSALQGAADVVVQFTPGQFHVRDNGGRDVVTEVDRAVNECLRGALLKSGEGWLSEEDADDRSRLSNEVVWVVDPLDGTREFVDGIPEWCISIGLVIEGNPVAGGIYNPATCELFLGGMRSGVLYNGRQVGRSSRKSLDGALVLASRQEYLRGEWNSFQQRKFTVKPVGSIAYKLALVAAGSADATWTLTPKHEWDVAAGVALVASARGFVEYFGVKSLCINQQSLSLHGLLACAVGISEELLAVMGEAGLPG